jgi:hypothetical protein
MNETEKAKELVNKMYNCELDISYYAAKQCAIIAVDEKIAYAKTFGDVTQSDVEEFEQIKKEIELL